MLRLHDELLAKQAVMHSAGMPRRNPNLRALPKIGSLKALGVFSTYFWVREPPLIHKFKDHFEDVKRCNLAR